VDEALPDREIRRGYCFVIREVSVSLLHKGSGRCFRDRAIGVLPYFTISGKVFYRTKDVHKFIRTRFAEVEERAAKRKEKEARKAERRRKRGLFP